MEEDLEFNRFIRDALESRGAFEVSRRAARRRAFSAWGVPAMLAASLSLAAILHATFSPRVDRVSDAIELLSVTEGLELEGDSAAELLLAWQDAPCSGVL